MDEAVTLTPRQRQILRGIVAGQKYKEIAEDLGLACETVKMHAKRLRKKLGLNSKVKLAIWALNHKVHKNGRMDPSEES